MVYRVTVIGLYIATLAAAQPGQNPVLPATGVQLGQFVYSPQAQVILNLPG